MPTAAATANVQLLYVFVTLSSPEGRMAIIRRTHRAPTPFATPADMMRRQRQTEPTAARQFLHLALIADNFPVSANWRRVPTIC
jgi:hypothetical protein